MAVEAELDGALLVVDDLDPDNATYLAYCHEESFHLQRCDRCDLIRFPPMGGCPHCGFPESNWIPVEPKGTVYSYTRVWHAPKQQEPYAVAIVELDVQRQPAGAALRIPARVVASGNQGEPSGMPEIRIGQRMRMTFRRISDDVALPAWIIDDGS
jgi:uncharacterized OB-fold protein